MNLKNKIFNNQKYLSVDKFFDFILYNKKYGYYFKKIPLGKNGDFITSPLISNLFSEMIAIWIVDFWQKIGSPNNFNIVELGPGDGTLIEILNQSFKNFPKFRESVNIYLYEKSLTLKKIQRKNISNNKVKWISKLSDIKKGPVIFIGNEFLDAIPIKQFIRKKNNILEKNLYLDKNNKIKDFYKIANAKDKSIINSFYSLKKNKFIEFPKKGFFLLDKIVKKIFKENGGILLIDYGYLGINNYSTLQSVKKHKKNKLFENLGNADITSLVNFRLLKEYFTKRNLKVRNIVSQSFFLKRIGIIERANILSKKMNFKSKADLYYRLSRIIDPKNMGELFKVIFAYKSKNNNFIGFD